MTDTYGSAGGSPSGAQATAQAAKEQAAGVAQTTAQAGGQVASTAVDAGTEVAQTAVDQSKQVAAEAARQAQDLANQARDQVKTQAVQQQQRAAGGLRSLADELTAMTNGGGSSGPATDLARQASTKVQELAGWLENREPGEVLDELRTFARRRPGAFLVGAALAGVVAGRLTRGVKEASSSGGSGQQGYAGTGRQFTGGAVYGESGLETSLPSSAYPVETTPTVGTVPTATGFEDSGYTGEAYATAPATPATYTAAPGYTGNPDDPLGEDERIAATGLGYGEVRP